MVCLNVRILVNLRRDGRIRVTRKVLMKALGRLKERILVCLRGQIRTGIARKVVVEDGSRVRSRVNEMVRILFAMRAKVRIGVNGMVLMKVLVVGGFMVRVLVRLRGNWRILVVGDLNGALRVM